MASEKRVSLSIPVEHHEVLEEIAREQRVHDGRVYRPIDVVRQLVATTYREYRRRESVGGGRRLVVSPPPGTGPLADLLKGVGGDPKASVVAEPEGVEARAALDPLGDALAPRASAEEDEDASRDL